MDFVMQNIGWLVGILTIIVLALIGSYADKKEKKQLIKEPIEPEKPEETTNPFEINKTLEQTPSMDTPQPETSNFQNNDASLYAPLETIQNNEQSNEIDPSLYAPLESVTTKPNEIDSSLYTPLEEIKNENEEIATDKSLYAPIEQTTQPEETISEIPMEFNNIENLNMSLEDLEKKNYDKILDKKIAQEELIPDFTNDDNYLDETLANENINKIFDNEIVDTTQNNIPLEEPTIEPNIQPEETIVEPTIEPTIQPEETIVEPVVDNNEQTAEDTQNTIIDKNETPEDKWSFNSEPVKYDDEIPELFQTNTQPKTTNDEIKHWEELDNNTT